MSREFSTIRPPLNTASLLEKLEAQVATGQGSGIFTYEELSALTERLSVLLPDWGD